MTGPQPSLPGPSGTLPIAAPPLLEASTPIMEPILFLTARLSDLATMTPSTEVQSLPARNLQNPEPSKVWRTLSAIDQFVDIVLSSPAPCDAVALTFPPEAFGGFSAAGQWRVRAWASLEAVGTTPADFDSGGQSVWPSSYRHPEPDWGNEHALMRLSNVTPFKYWRVEFSDPGIGKTYLDIGRLALGIAYQASQNFDADKGSISYMPIDVQEPNGYGQTFTDPRPYAQRQFKLTWSMLNHMDVAREAMELSRLRGQARDLYVFLDPTEIEQFHLYAMQCLFSGNAEFVTQPVWFTDPDGVSRQGWGFTFSMIQKL